MTLTFELPDSLVEELGNHGIAPHQVRAFVVQALEAWLRVQSADTSLALNQSQTSRFEESAVPFVEKLVRENRELFERLTAL